MFSLQRMSIKVRSEKGSNEEMWTTEVTYKGEVP